MYHRALCLGLQPTDTVPLGATVDDDLFSKLPDLAQDCFRDVWLKITEAKDKTIRTSVVSNFLRLYQGQLVSSIKIYEKSIGWCVVYMVEQL